MTLPARVWDDRPVNPFDLIAIVLIVGALLLGFRSGALPQVGGLVGALVGGVLAILALPWLETPLASIDPGIRPIVVLGGLLLAVVAGESIGSATGRAAGRALGTGVLGAADRVGGSVIGVGQALLIVWLAGGLLAVGPFTRLSGWAQTSTAARTLNAILPPPTELAGELGRLLDASGLPEVFIGFEPLPAAPVDRPDDPRARAIAAVAEASTVRISAATCGVGSTGTGFAVGPGYVVTNAHVIAGARSIRVTDLGGVRDATAVLFDPNLDIAVLHVPRLAAPALRFASRDPERGAIGAALGYPGGGALTILPAAVAGRYPAIGRDIYGAGRIQREIIELRARIDRGDSGGPFVLADGTVGGVVFAEARTDDEVGYALAPTAVAIRIAPALGRTGAVGTGACLR
jgi:S1-C subfamily serine protease